jgi:hypothetical protein
MAVLDNKLMFQLQLIPYEKRVNVIIETIAWKKLFCPVVIELPALDVVS